MKVYLINAVEKEHNITVLGVERLLALTWADGMIGVVSVFDSKEKALEYAGGHCSIMEVKANKWGEK